MGRIIKHENDLLTFTGLAPGKPANDILQHNDISDSQAETDPELKHDLLFEINAELEAPVLATRLLLGIPLNALLPELDVRLGTTRGTNALLTRGGANTAVLVTKGFADLLRIGEHICRYQ